MQTIEKTETKHDKFKRVVVPRVNKALHIIKLIGNCANSQYDYTDDDVQKIFDTLEQALSDTLGKFTKDVIKDKGFNLS